MSIVEIYLQGKSNSFLNIFRYSHWTWKVRWQNGFIDVKQFPKFTAKCVYRTRQNLEKIETYGPSNQFVNGLKRHLLIYQTLPIYYRHVYTQHVDIHG